MYEIRLRDFVFSANQPLVVIAGPCVIESEDHCLAMASALKGLVEKFDVPYVFKSSFLKANRSSLDSYVGPGLEEGLRVLEKVKSEISVPVISDVHSVEQVGPASEVLDILQIPAFLCRQTDLLVAAGNTGRIVNIKKGQFMAPQDMKNVIEKVKRCGNDKILLTERGTTFGYNNLVVDIRSLEIMKKLDVPVVFDATHSVQLPGGEGIRSGGQREFVACLAKAAVSVGIDALFLEVHDTPERAKCDGPNMITPTELSNLLPVLKKIDSTVKSGVYHGRRD